MPKSAASSLFLAVLFATGSTNAAPVELRDVMCGTVKCGTMNITEYSRVDPTVVNGVGGVSIAGSFTAINRLSYHYIQVVTTDDRDTFRWINDVTVPLPTAYVDSPPGGYRSEDAAGSKNYTEESAFDYLPWYDPTGVFPIFSDKPLSFLQHAKLQGDAKATDYFETWLVCLIDKELGPDSRLARDDSYTIAPLIGWTWGFDILYSDVGTIGQDDVADFTIDQRALGWLSTPTAAWTGALSAKYGTGEDQDYWNIAVGQCTNCTVPEPSTLVLGALALVGLGVSRRR